MPHLTPPTLTVAALEATRRAFDALVSPQAPEGALVHPADAHRFRSDIPEVQGVHGGLAALWVFVDVQGRLTRPGQMVMGPRAMIADLARLLDSMIDDPLPQEETDAER